MVSTFFTSDRLHQPYPINTALALLRSCFDSSTVLSAVAIYCGYVDADVQ